MKKKIIVLLLLILTGMGIFLSQNAWCVVPLWWVKHQPWEDLLLSRGGGGNNPNNNSTTVDTQNSTIINTGNISISETQSAFKRGDKVPNNFQQKQGNSGQDSN